MEVKTESLEKPVVDIKMSPKIDKAGETSIEMTTEGQATVAK